MGKQSHVLVIAYPAPSHVWILFKLSLLIADINTINVTFITTKFIQSRFLSAIPEDYKVRLVSIPDGLDQDPDWKDSVRVSESVLSVMPGEFEKLIRKIKEDEKEIISCVIADTTVWWALEIAEKMGIKRAAFYVSTIENLVLLMSIPRLIKDGIINEKGAIMKEDVIKLTPDMPTMSTKDFQWICPGNPTREKMIFEYGLATIKAVETSNWVLCNSFFELNPSACKLIPNFLPIGQLLSLNSNPSFGPEEDLTCVQWLDTHLPRSVVYISFGSIVVLDQQQFEELAFGLELLQCSFLWVVRADHGHQYQYPDGYMDRIAGRGKIVKWAPQEKVLTHSSIACFLTHCGANSAMEGIINGVPFLCWPCSAD